MFHVRETQRTFEDTAQALEAAVAAHGFGVLHVHDLGAILRGKGYDFPEECRVFEVCNPAQAIKVLSTDLLLNTALPCRISVYTERGSTKVALIRPVPLLEELSDDPQLAPIAREVENSLLEMVAAAV